MSACCRAAGQRWVIAEAWREFQLFLKLNYKKPNLE